MKEIQISVIAKSLENERDLCLGRIKDNDLLSQVIAKQINVFFSIYILTMSDMSKPIATDTLSLYRDYYATKFGGFRFLLELLLSSIDLLSSQDDAERHGRIISFALSEKINLHAIDKKILMIDPSNKNYLKKIDDNQRDYTQFLNHYGITSKLIPRDIATFFPDSGPDPLRQRKKDETKFYDEFGFTYHKHNKPNYTGIIEQNHQLKSIIASLQQTKVFNTAVNVALLRDLYSIFSGEIHPTFTAIESFDRFISQSSGGKQKLIDDHKDTIDTFLKVLGILMDALYKDFRGQDLSGLAYLESPQKGAHH